MAYDIAQFHIFLSFSRDSERAGAEQAIRLNSGLNRVRAQSWFGPYGLSAGSLILALSAGSDLLDPFLS